ncbi:hypothetical protein ACFTWQ_04890 [[Kitasatospora] papulosa]|uniref:hypothetical protein n=1 Tax=[Kitasatospora] papulosa TaxID=1464011 RepID=UPI003637B7F9
MQATLLTFGLAALVAAMQTWIKYASRRAPAGQSHALRRDDALFWIDWIVTAAVALGTSLVSASMQGKPVGTIHVGVALAVLVLGLAVMPKVVQELCYDSSGDLKGWSHIICANAAGLIILLSSVVAGVKIYA